MSKPSWEDAPEWANALATDGNGVWWWFENEPKFLSSREGFGLGGRMQRATSYPYFYMELRP